MQNSTKFYIKKLSSKFYEDYPQKIYEEILSKKDRPYTCLMIQNRGYWISVPFRTEIHHEYAYHFKMSERSKKHHSGLDYTKCVIITKTEYISEESPVIDQDEYRELVRNIGKVIDSVIQFIDEYVADRKGNKKLHTKEFERRYAFSTLRYFHGELGLEEKKYKNLKQEEIPMLRDKVRKYYLEQDCNGVQREHNKKLNNGLPILHKVPPKRDYGRYFCIIAEKGGTSHGGLTEKLSLFFHAKKQEVNAYGR